MGLAPETIWQGKYIKLIKFGGSTEWAGLGCQSYFRVHREVRAVNCTGVGLWQFFPKNFEWPCERSVEGRISKKNLAAWIEELKKLDARIPELKKLLKAEQEEQSRQEAQKIKDEKQKLFEKAQERFAKVLTENKNLLDAKNIDKLATVLAKKFRISY